MAEVLFEYDNVIRGRDHRQYTAKACGREGHGGLWDGWLEFSPGAGAPVLRTGRETTQPNRDDLLYWATGLTHAYLEGALERALAPDPRPAPSSAVSGRPAYDEPAQPQRGAQVDERAYPIPAPHAVLDPFAVYAEGDGILRGQLEALDESQLRNIIRAYELAEDTGEQLERLSKPMLVERIVRVVEQRSNR